MARVVCGASFPVLRLCAGLPSRRNLQHSMSSRRLLALRRARELSMPFLKNILDWQAEHPNITWIGWGVIWAGVLGLFFWPQC